MSARQDVINAACIESPDGNTFNAELLFALDAYAAEARLATLREVRKAAMALDKNPDNDPYLWGYGGGEICKMIGAKVREARGEQ